MSRLGRVVVTLMFSVSPPALQAEAHDYRLHPQTVADGIWIIEGAREHFNRDNGGNIVNTAFIASEAGAIVIDTGTSRLYGEQMRAQIAAQGHERIARVYNTHAHPDHFLGNQAFVDAPIAALPATLRQIAEQGSAFTDNLYRLVGSWMAGTVAVPPTQSAASGDVTIGGRSLQLLALDGHTDGDLAILDRRTGTLFAGDLVFYQRTPTTPHADIGRWLQALDRLDALEYRVLVPGHGPVVRGPEAIAQTRDYLLWLRTTLHDAADRGLDMPELLRIEPPPRLRGLAVFREELARSVEHLFPAEEQRVLQVVP